MSKDRPDNQAPQEYTDSFTGLSQASTESTVSMQRNIGYQSGTMGGTQDTTLASSRGQAVTVASEDPFIGRTIGDHYQILSRLGSGGMSVVYKARHTLLHRNMAVKFLLPQSDLDSKTLSRFQQEAKAAFTLNHLNIARVNELGIDNGEMPYIVMDYVEGPTLGELIEKEAPLPANRVISIIGQACAGLEHAHQKDIIHRDIKPGNLILTTEGNLGEILKIVDFGIAKILHEAEGTQHLTQTGEVFGSPLYMSPEQAMGKTLDHRCDIYALGCVMYETLAGKPPFRGINILDTLTKHINDDPPPLTNAPAALRVIVKRAMEKNPNDRYQTMTEFKRDLEAANEGTQSKLTSTYKLLVKPKVRRWVVPVAAAVAGVVGFLVYGAVETAPSPRFEHRVATTWMWSPEPADRIKRLQDNAAAQPKPEEAANTGSANGADGQMGSVIPDSERKLKDGTLRKDLEDANHSEEISFPNLALHLSQAEQKYKSNSSPAELQEAIDLYAWACKNWDACVAGNDPPRREWDHGLAESRLADSYLLTDKPEEALAHYSVAHGIWDALHEPGAAANISMSSLDRAYVESKLKKPLTESPSLILDNLNKAFAGSKYLGIVKQDWSNVQWNLGSPMDSEASRVQAFFDRMDASKKPYTDLPLAKS